MPDSGEIRQEKHRYLGNEGLVIDTRLLALEREQKENKRVDQRQTRWLMIFTGLLFVGSIVTNLLMVRQLTDARMSTEAAVASAREARRSADTAEANLRHSRQATESMLRDSREALERTLFQNQKALRATIQQGQRALQSSLAMFSLDQRPWLAAYDFVLSAEPEENKKIYVTLKYRNTGKTPAFYAANLTDLSIYDEEPPNTYNVAPDLKVALNVILPGDTTETFSTDWIPPSKSIAAYKARTHNLYLRSWINYDDGYGANHSTQVCAYHVSGEALTFFHYCRLGRIMD